MLHMQRAFKAFSYRTLQSSNVKSLEGFDDNESTQQSTCHPFIIVVS